MGKALASCERNRKKRSPSILSVRTLFFAQPSLYRHVQLIQPPVLRVRAAGQEMCEHVLGAPRQDSRGVPAQGRRGRGTAGRRNGSVDAKQEDSLSSWGSGGSEGRMSCVGNGG